MEPFAFCDSRPATAAGQGRAFTLLVRRLRVHTTLCVGSVSESKFEGRRLGRLSFEPAR